MATDSHRPDSPRPDAVETPSLPSGPTSGPVRVARIESYEDGPDECTIHPVDAPADALTTTWITARGDAFVRLDAMR
jgi:hypothetical protein